MDRIRIGIVVMASLAVALLGGCSSSSASRSQSPAWTFDGASYADVFDATRDALRTSHFDIARVDARMGVIMSAPAGSSGIATPWIGHGVHSPYAAASGLAHRQRRVVRVTFAAQHGDQPAPQDLRDWTGPMEGRVEVMVERIYRPGRQVDSTSIRQASFWRDPRLRAEGLQPGYATVIGEDPELAGLLAARIRAESD